MTPTAFPGIRGHEALLGSLDQALREERVAPALLFHGPAGVGKLTAALGLFRALLCEAPAPGACGRCDSCLRISAKALLHSDVGLLFPQTMRGSESGRDGGEEGGDPAEPRSGAVDLHALQEEARLNASWKILAERTRERLRELFLSPGMGRRRVLLILAAERLGGVSGNILLKVLEEPPGGSVILLLCENPSALLPTIRSRCQSCRFSPLSWALVEAFLLERGAAAPEEARLIASLSGGRIGAALELARDAEGYRSRRDLLSGLLLTLRRNPSAAASLAAARELVSGESEAVEDLSILMDVLRDAMLSDAGCPPSLLTDPRTFSTHGDSRIPAPVAADLLIRVERAREDLRRNVNRQVALETLFLDLGRSDPTSPEWD